ncbi:uncharacterized protein LOC108907399 [Anoplophora glabripennis]|uniref:uncharacterized protein LOC108907399 n=1 Tax=Anoplophora glabripennis TaxID=217634 RepID=UPI00087551A7|nr:uncharacterized protein LOC108907399 [Anoplophora glabripennis]
MKTIVIFGCIIALAMAQRPSFAGTSAKVYPELASRFQDTSSNSEPSSIGNSLANRVGETPKISTTTQKLPHDVNVVNRFNQQPYDSRPYKRLHLAGSRNHY